MVNDKTYNGWTNYETWAVKLWMDNEQSTQEYYREEAQRCYDMARDAYPNQFMDKAANARLLLSQQIKSDYDDDSTHDVFKAAEGTVYADLLNAALSEVNWHEIAASLLEEVDKAEETEGVDG